MIYKRMAHFSGSFSWRMKELPLVGYFILLLCIRPSRSELGSDPHMHIEGYQDGGISILCTAEGWSPKPSVLWKDDSGKKMTPISESLVPVTNGFDIQTVYVVNKQANKNVSCSIRDVTLSQEKTSTLHIADTFFQRVARCGVSCYLIGTSFVILAICLIALGVYLFRKQCAEKANLKKQIDDLQEELEWRRARSHADEVTLAETGSSFTVSEDRKSVSPSSEKEDPVNPETFDKAVVVLGKEEFSSDKKHYWEVEVEGKTEWSLGVCEKSGPTDWKHWGLSLHNNQYKSLTSKSIVYPKGAIPKKVGVFLEYKEGKVSIYSVEGKSKLLTEEATPKFTGKICPFFNPGRYSKDRNEAPLKICPVPEWD